MCWMPSREQSCCQVDDGNCVPLSEVRVAGTPNIATQEEMKAAAHVQWNSFQPPGCSVDHGEDVAEAVGGDRQGPHQFHMHVAEATLRDGDRLDWSCWLLGHHSTLALLT